jgi:hypothetical protein
MVISVVWEIITDCCPLSMRGLSGLRFMHEAFGSVRNLVQRPVNSPCPSAPSVYTHEKYEYIENRVDRFSSNLISKNICEELLGDFDFYLDRMILTITLHEDLHIVLLISRA